VGGGTGFASVQLARMGYDVVLLDASEEMLRVAVEQAGTSSAPGKISLCHRDARQVPNFSM
jgi:ubiquinone/menaquinone biosynthesis C-methylase UbiE